MTHHKCSVGYFSSDVDSLNKVSIFDHILLHNHLRNHHHNHHHKLHHTHIHHNHQQHNHQLHILHHNHRNHHIHHLKFYHHVLLDLLVLLVVRISSVQFFFHPIQMKNVEYTF